MDNCYYINLTRSVERKADMEKQLQKNNIKINRIPAVEGMLLKEERYRIAICYELGIKEMFLKEDWLLNRSNFKTLSRDINYILPRFGLYLSTIRALQSAYKDGHTSCIVMEDDAQIINQLNIPVIDQADIIYLGGTFSGDKYLDDPVVKIIPDKIKVFGTFGYFIQDIKSMLCILKSPFQLGEKGFDKNADWRSGKVKLRCQNIDLFFKNYFQKYGNCYFLNPPSIIHPNDNISTINTKTFDYIKRGLRFIY